MENQKWTPPEWAIIAFTVFAIFVTAFDYALVYWLPYEWSIHVRAYTGISMSTFYMFSLIFVGLYLFGRNRTNVLKGDGTGTINTVGFMMGLQILFGLYYQVMYLTSSDEFYKRGFHPIQSLYTIVLPMVWIMVLFYPQIRLRLHREA